VSTACPGVLLPPLQRGFGWSTAAISSAVAVRLLPFGLMGLFAAALHGAVRYSTLRPRNFRNLLG
jgi:hypothetical protein